MSFGNPGQGGEPGSRIPFQPVDDSIVDDRQVGFGVDQNTLAMAKAIDPDSPKSKKDEKLAEIREITPELEPYRQELMEWIGTEDNPKPIYRELLSFLQYRNVKFKLIGGSGFYFSPAAGVISLSVPFFKEMKDKFGNEMSPMQFVFGAMHEFAHLKTMIELNDAGLHNLLKQFDYTSQKGFFAEGQDGQITRMTAGETYDFFYNILEDAMVNRMVFNTMLYGDNFADGRKNREEICQLYTEKFFPIELNEGQIAQKEDYEAGFDWNKTKTKMNRTGQFSTFFIKNQMMGLSEKTVFDAETNPDGSHVLNDDVSIIFTRPLSEVYATLLRRIEDKYKGDPKKYANYLRFMTETVRVPVYGEDKGKIKRVRNDDVTNVLTEEKIDGDGKINIDLAVFEYSRGSIRPLLDRLGVKKHASAVTFLDLFNQFKELDHKNKTGGSIPFVLGLQERLEAARHIFEPIFSMLCVLDDSFKTAMPPTDDSPPRPAKPPEWPRDNNWRPGDWVQNGDPNSPHFQKRGRIVRINGDAEKPESVMVVYDSDQKHLKRMPSQMMADFSSGKILNNFSGETETIFMPNKNLILLYKRGKRGGEESSEVPPVENEKDERRKMFAEDEENEEEDKEDDNGDGDIDDTFENPDEDEDKGGDKKGKGGQKEDDSGEGEGGEGEDDQGESGEDHSEEAKEVSKKGLSRFRKFVEQLLREKRRERRVTEIEDELSSKGFKEKKRDLDEEARLVEKLAEARRKLGIQNPEGHQAILDREMIKEIRALEDELTLDRSTDKMAKAWLEVIRNIASKIHTLREKYFRSGKVDIKKLQRYFLEIQEGQDIDNRLIYSRIVEKIVTELRPRALRVVLLIDNSGSMSGAKAKRMKMAIMLLNSSLRSFKELFKMEIQNLYRSFGSQPPSDDELDITIDIQVRLFGNDEPTLAKPFDITDYSFLVDKKKPRPKLDPDQELISSVLAFQAITTKEGTYDRSSWERIVLDHGPDTQTLINEGVMSEAIIEITDGSFNSGNSRAEIRKQVNSIYSAMFGKDLPQEDGEAVRAMIELIREKMNIGVAGFAIGDNPGETKTAFDSLAARMGDEKSVIPANSTDEIVENFSGLLRNIIVQRFANQMIMEIDKVEQKLKSGV